MKRRKIPSESAEPKMQTSANVQYSGHAELSATEAGLIGYSTDIVRKLARTMKIKSRFRTDIKILEFGAGSGFLADIWEKETGSKPDCCEIDPKLVLAIQDRGFSCVTSLDQLSHKYQGIYTSNVLEHIENDSLALKDLYNCLEPGGAIGIYVPAFPFLFSEMDELVGHFRRYRRSELISKVEAAGFTLESCTYSDFVGYFASIFLKLVGFKRRANLGSVKSLNFYDVWIYPISRALDALGFRYLAGKNLILVARK